jgi:hypothetical protein
VAFSTAALKGYEDRIDQGQFFDFDEATFFGRINGGPNGAIVRDAFDQLLKVGYPPDEASHKIAAYFAVPVAQADIQAALMAFGPVVLATDWFSEWFTPDRVGVLPAPRVKAGGHAIVAIGWDARGLRLRNSWGAAWGQSGDCYLPWAYLGKVWEIWKAVDVIENPPTEADMILLPKPVRLFDGPLRSGVSVALRVAGLQGIPANATGAALGIQVIEPPDRGWLYAGPVAGVPTSIQGISTMVFNAGQDNDGFPIVGLTNGVLTLWATCAIPRLVIDATAYLVEA